MTQKAGDVCRSVVLAIRPGRGYQLVRDSNFGNIEQALGPFEEGKPLDACLDWPQDLQLFRLEQIQVRDIDDRNPIRTQRRQCVLGKLLIKIAHR